MDRKREYMFEVYKLETGALHVFFGIQHLWLTRPLMPNTSILARFENEKVRIHVYANYDAPEAFCLRLVGHVMAREENIEPSTLKPVDPNMEWHTQEHLL